MTTQNKTTFPVPFFASDDLSQLVTAFPKIDQLYQAFAQQHHVPGLAYGIVAGGALIHTNGIGFANVEQQTPVSADTVFRIASMTKSFTTMALLKLRDENKLQLDAPAVDYIPELIHLKYPTRDSAPITVRQLMTMHAGLPQDDPWADRNLALSEEAFTEWLKGGFSFSNPPGIKFEYSNLGYALLGRIVTNASGKRYQDYVQEEILLPLGMTSSTFDLHAVDPVRLAMGYHPIEGEWSPRPPLEDGAFASIGGLFTTIHDFSKYMVFLLSAFPARDDEEAGPVRRSSLREMQQPYNRRFVTAMRTAPDQPAYISSDAYGFGLASMIDSSFGLSVSHGGGLPGYGTYYRLLPDYGLGVVSFANQTYTPNMQIINSVLSLLFATNALKPRALPVASALIETQTQLMNLFNQWNDDTALALATESFFLDLALERRRVQFQQLRREFGPCKSVTAVIPENALRGRWIMQCQRGTIEVFATLAPTVPPRLQYLILTPAKPLSRVQKQAVQRLVKLINRWDDVLARQTFARNARPQAYQPQFSTLQLQYGKLRLGNVLEGDGKQKARVRLLGQAYHIDMQFTINPATGKIESVIFTRPRETDFIP